MLLAAVQHMKEQHGEAPTYFMPVGALTATLKTSLLLVWYFLWYPTKVVT